MSFTPVESPKLSLTSWQGKKVKLQRYLIHLLPANIFFRALPFLTVFHGLFSRLMLETTGFWKWPSGMAGNCSPALLKLQTNQEEQLTRARRHSVGNTTLTSILSSLDSSFAFFLSADSSQSDPEVNLLAFRNNSFHSIDIKAACSWVCLGVIDS